MCRCNPNLRTPYCEKCNDLYPRKGIEGLSLMRILEQGWSGGDDVRLTFRTAREKGYVVTLGEIDVAYMVFQYNWEKSVLRGE